MPLGLALPPHLCDNAVGQSAVCFVGDGGSLFSIHALWTAAKYRIPSIFICFVNHEYRLLKDLWCQAMGTSLETTRFVGMDFTDPNVDLHGIAAGLGARTEIISDLGTLGEVLTRALAHAGPSFLLVEREP
jgi:benzoylformate decarboxylase